MIRSTAVLTLAFALALSGAGCGIFGGQDDDRNRPEDRPYGQDDRSQPGGQPPANGQQPPMDQQPRGQEPSIAGDGWRFASRDVDSRQPADAARRSGLPA